MKSAKVQRVVGIVNMKRRERLKMKINKEWFAIVGLTIVGFAMVVIWEIIIQTFFGVY